MSPSTEVSVPSPKRDFLQETLLRIYRTSEKNCLLFILNWILRFEGRLYNIMLFLPTVTERANQAKESLYEINIDKYDG